MRFDVQRAADKRGAFANARETKPSLAEDALLHLVDVEAATVVIDDQS